VKKIPLLMSIALLAGALLNPSSPAKAQPFAGAASCSITLPVWPTTGPNTSGPVCEGTAVGADAARAGSDPLYCWASSHPPPPHGEIGCTIRVRVARYNETCVNPLPPPLGFADGTIEEPIVADFNWVRVGLTAVLVPGETAGVAAFAPLPPIPSCGASGTLTAQVVGVALAP
jgi:hypothetical protein